MKLQQLKYFNALCRLKSFQRVVASNFQRSSQPYCRFAIKSLEEDLGVQLILRNQSQPQMVISLLKGAELLRNIPQCSSTTGHGNNSCKNAHDGRIKSGHYRSSFAFRFNKKHISSLPKRFFASWR